MSVLAYTRVSTARQADEGESLEVQQRQISGYALMHGLEVTKLYVESGVSGSVPLGDRPQGRQLLATLKPGDIVVASKLDRVFRSAVDALNVSARLKAQNVGLHLLDLNGDVSGNGMAKFFLTMAAAFAELERSRIQERVGEVKRDQRARGRFLGGSAPFGWRVGEGGALMARPEQQAALAQIRALRAEGLSLRAIAAQVTKNGIPVSHVAVANSLKAAARL